MKLLQQSLMQADEALHATKVMRINQRAYMKAVFEKDEATKEKLLPMLKNSQDRVDELITTYFNKN